MSFKSLLEQLEIYRLEHKVSQERLAQMLGVHFSTVNRWFQGKQKPSKIQLYHIKKFLQEHAGEKSE